jgi:chromosome segregation ATPase
MRDLVPNAGHDFARELDRLASEFRTRLAEAAALAEEHLRHTVTDQLNDEFDEKFKAGTAMVREELEARLTEAATRYDLERERLQAEIQDLVQAREDGDEERQQRDRRIVELEQRVETSVRDLEVRDAKLRGLEQAVTEWETRARDSQDRADRLEQERAAAIDERNAGLEQLEALRQQVAQAGAELEQREARIRELETTENAIRRVSDDIESMVADADVRLSDVMRKKSEHAELVAYLRGLQYEAGGGS